VNITFEI